MMNGHQPSTPDHRAAALRLADCSVFGGERLKLRQGVVLLRLDNNTLLLDSPGSRYMVLNRVAYEMIRVAASSETDQIAVEELLQVLAVDRETLERDLRDFQMTFREYNLLAPS